MPPWVAEVVRLLWWGSSTGWFGLGCPAHCSSSLPLLLSVFVSGFCLGAFSLLVFVWTFRYTLFQPLDFAPTPSRRSPTSRARCGGGRERCRRSIRCRHHPDACGLQRISFASYPRVRPIQRLPRDPLFLGRRSSGGAIVESSFAVGFGLDGRGGIRESPVLLSGGECPCRDCRAPSSQEVGGQEEDHQCSSSRAAVAVVRCPSWNHARATRTEGEAGHLRRSSCQPGHTSCGGSPSQDALPSGPTTVHRSRLRQEARSCTKDQGLPSPSDKDGYSRWCPVQRRPKSPSGRLERGFRSSGRPPFSDTGDLPTKPGYDGSCGPPCVESGPPVGSGLFLFNVAVNQRCGEEGEASATAIQSQRGFLSTSVPPGFEKDQAFGPPSGDHEGLAKEGHLLEVHGEARRHGRAARLCPGDVVALPDRGCYGGSEITKELRSCWRSR